jgi:hypothetical protein
MTGGGIPITDATSALAVLLARPIPLLITDYHLSDTRGDELASALKAASPTTKVMIAGCIELNAQAGSGSVDHCLIKAFPQCAT